MKNYLHLCLAIVSLFTLQAKAYTVTELKATYQNGQTFLTWKEPGVTNLKYKVYRSASKIKSTSQLNDENFLGYVLNNSAKNIRKSKLEDGNFFFTINPNEGTLASDRGLYVATGTDNHRHFYAVMVVELSSNIEDKTIILNSNSLSTGVKEHTPAPQPVLQNIITQPNGDIHYECVIFGNNQDAPHQSAFNNCGSYGYNFTLVNRNAGPAAPLYIRFQDDDPFAPVGSDECDECNLLLLDDWLPNGNNSYWVGFNTNYDMYSDDNPVQTSGTIRTYTQNRLRTIIEWCAAEPNVDATRVYASGFSHNGFGALLTSMMIPGLIAATQENSSPILIKASAVDGSVREQQWCDGLLSLNSDVTDPATGDTLSIWQLLDMRAMLRLNENRSLPFMSGVNGKQDITTGWVNKNHWYDSVNLSRHGGTWFWDQRNHTNDGKNYLIEETQLNFLRFATNKSYPAFAYCSINQNPGNGSTDSGDPFGAINGYLDWDDNSITDRRCSYSILCLIKDFYVGGVLQKKFDSCATDLTLRRLQNFQPTEGQVVNWKVKKSNNQIVQQGSMIYNSNEPLTLYGVKIYKTGSTVSFNIENCQKEIADEAEATQRLTVARAVDGYKVTLNLTASSDVEVIVTDMSGRIVSEKLFSGQAGDNSFSIKLNSGTYVLRAKAAGFSESRKLVF